VISIYYYIRVVKMMVVKEPHEMSESVKNYPPISWDLPGLRSLQVGLVMTVIVTSLAGILSNPLFTLANNAVMQTPMLELSLSASKETMTTQVAKAAALRQLNNVDLRG
jgi:NAD(P)H-quinone oxidoreductase subunit 2